MSFFPSGCFSSVAEASHQQYIRYLELDKLGLGKAPLVLGVVLPNEELCLSRALCLLAHPLEEVAFCPPIMVNNRLFGSEKGSFWLSLA